MLLLSKFVITTSVSFLASEFIPKTARPVFAYYKASHTHCWLAVMLQQDTGCMMHLLLDVHIQQQRPLPRIVDTLPCCRLLHTSLENATMVVESQTHMIAAL